MSIQYENGNIKFTILEKNSKYHLDFYTPAGERKRKSTKRPVNKENLKYIKNVLIPDIVLALGQEPTENKEKKEWTLEEWTQKHFELQEGKNRPQTIRTKLQHYYKHIYPVLGNRLVSTIGYLDLETWQTNILKKINPKTKKLYKIQTITTFRSILFSILEHAVKAEILEKNHFKNIPSPKTFRNLSEEQKSSDINPFTEDEMNLILKNATGYLKNFIIVMRYTGMRPGEIIALGWEDIDFQKRVIYVCKTRRKKIENATKTESSMRKVDMLLKAKEALENQLSLTKGKEKAFMSMFNEPFYSHDIIAKLFRELLIKIGILPRPLYNLRHTFASQAITKSVNILWVSKMLGHKDISITLQVYAKFIVENDDKRLKNIEKLDKIL